ncbi:thiol peroxidase [Methylosoma difficile]
MATLSFQGQPVYTNGDLPAVGSQAPDFCLVNSQLADISLAAYAGKRKILHIVPSLDTPTCAASTLRFNEKAAHLPNTVVLVISADLPFAQCRFCTHEGLKHVIPLSTFRSRFAEDYGIKIQNGLLAGLTARAIVILDENDQVLYNELLNELAHEPNYEEALAVCRNR